MTSDNDISRPNGHDHQDKHLPRRHILEAQLDGLRDDFGFHQMECYDGSSDDELQQLIDKLNAKKHEVWKEEDTLRSATTTQREKQAQFQRVMFKAWDAMAEAGFKASVQLTFLLILRYCWSKDHCSVFESTLVKAMNCNVRTLQRSLETLVEKNWIKIEHHHRDKSTYIILRKDLIPPYIKIR